MSHSPLINVDQDLKEIAVQAGLLEPDQEPSGALLAYGYDIIAACARIGDRYRAEDANPGDHIRAVFFPHPDA